MSDTMADPRRSESAAARPPAVSVHGVTKLFDDGMVHALDGVDLTVQEGEWIAITGPSGCGKSTLLNLIAALDKPTEGTITVFGQQIHALRHAAHFRRDTVGLVFQMHNLLPQLTAAQNVEVAMFGQVRHRRDRRVRALQLLQDVDLAGREHRPPTRLAGGERQRVAIARALANEPRILLADEPTGSLDSASVTRVIDLFSSLRQRRPELTIIVVTHDDRVAAAADRTIRLRDGAIDKA